MERTKLAFQNDGHITALQVAIKAIKPFESLEAPDKGLFKPGKEGDYAIITDATIFHPQGGGQPSDIGTIQSEKGEIIFTVDLVRFGATTQGQVLHFGRFSSPATGASFSPGDKVTQQIDTAKRLLYSRYHTAGHVLGAAVRKLLEKEIPDFEEIKASHAPDSAAVEFRGAIDATKWKDPIQAKLDELIKGDIPVEIDWWDEEDFKANGMEKLIPDRAAMNMKPEEKFRVVKMVGVQAYPCGGTHVDTTGLCGKTNVKKINRPKGISKVGYVLAD